MSNGGANKAYVLTFLLSVLAGWGVGMARGGIVLSPLKQEISLRPGEEGKVTITLASNQHEGVAALPQGMRLEVVDVQVSEEGGLGFKEAGTLENSASKWVSLSHQELTLEARESQVVECSIKVPQTAAAGEYYTAVLVTLGSKGRSEKGFAIEYRFASGIFVTVTGRTLVKQGKIGRCELLWPRLGAGAGTQPAGGQPAEVEPPRVSVLLQNVGQGRFEGSGKVTILDERSRVVMRGSLTSARPCVFGGDSRLFDAPLSKPLAAGKYRIKVEMDYQSSWAKARQELGVEILPEQAEFLALQKKRHQDEAGVVETTPESVVATLPAGATRSLALMLRNNSEGAVRCVSTLAGGMEGWITVGPAECSISKGGRKSVGVTVQVPAGTKAGRYSSLVTIEAAPEGAEGKKLIIPVEIEVK